MKPLLLAQEGGWSMETLKFVFVDRLPKPSAFGFQLYFGWLLFQGLLYAVLPATIATGQRTPAGYLLQYKVNGLLAWFVSHALFISCSWGLGWFKPSIIFDNWGPLVVAMNVYGYFLAAFAYVKAHLFPTHAEDRKFSGSIIYDIFMGVECTRIFVQFIFNYNDD
jgi:7-dehydrocholesterol reductase